MKENDTEYINTEILTILSNRINDMYNNMFLLFPVEKTSLSEYIEFCSNNVSKKTPKYLLFYPCCTIVLLCIFNGNYKLRRLYVVL